MVKQSVSITADSIVLIIIKYNNHKISLFFIELVAILNIAAILDSTI